MTASKPFLMSRGRVVPASSLPHVSGWHDLTQHYIVDMTEAKQTAALDEDELAALKAQLKHNQAIAGLHVDILKRIQRLDKLGGKQDYSLTILEVLKAFGGTVSLAFLGPVLPEHDLLMEAREKLVKEGLITETTVKNRKTLHLVTAE